MAKTISISDHVYARLQALARPFEDREAEDVIRRLLDGEKENSAQSGYVKSKSSPDPAVTRAPRERGTVVELNGEKLSATTIPDLCAKALEYLYAHGLWDDVEKLAPYETSKKRYLFAKSPIHPQGNDFFVPIKYKNIYMETHKNYKTAIEQLRRLFSQLGITFKYIQ